VEGRSAIQTRGSAQSGHIVGALGSAGPERRPALALAGVAAFGVLCVIAAVMAARDPGWLGARLAASGESCARVVALSPNGPLAQAGGEIGDCLVSLSGATRKAQVRGLDLTEDPDQFSTRALQADYLRNQTEIAAVLSEKTVRAGLRGANGLERDAYVAPSKRPLLSLPFTFWITIASGLVGLIVGAWVWMLRSGDAAARWLGVAGLGLFVAAMPPAIYSTRELAIEGEWQSWLSLANHGGGFVLGLGLCAFFLDFPNRIGPAWLKIALFAGFGAWFALDIAQVTTPVHFYTLDLAQMGSVLTAWGAQACLTRHDRDKRPALLWLGVATVFGVAAAALGMVGPIVFGAEPLMSQGYLFAFFATFFGTVAVGVGRHHMFDMGRWAYRILFYAVGAATMMAIDATLVFGLNFERSFALMVSILIVGLAYLPARDMVWRRYAAPRRPPAHEFFGKAMDVAFGLGESEQDRRWRELLSDLFDPLEIEAAFAEPTTPTLAEGRSELLTPAVAGSPALRLRHPYGGKALFSADDVKMATRLIELVRRAERGRDDYARGVVEERARIARDLHDDLGARLLRGAVGADADARALSQAALKDLRSILSDLSAGALDLDEALANLRHETAERVADAGLALDWPAIDEELSRHKVDPRQMKALASSVREAVSNAIRHSGGTKLTVRVAAREGRVTISVRDDGRGLAAARATAGAGQGLRNMRERMGAAEGEARVESSDAGVTATFDMPLRLGAAASGGTP
jgi:two-component system sensor histidine kinase DevS